MLTGYQVSALICQVLKSGRRGMGGIRERNYIYLCINIFSSQGAADRILLICQRFEHELQPHPSPEALGCFWGIGRTGL